MPGVESRRLDRGELEALSRTAAALGPRPVRARMRRHRRRAASSPISRVSTGWGHNLTRSEVVAARRTKAAGALKRLAARPCARRSSSTRRSLGRSGSRICAVEPLGLQPKRRRCPGAGRSARPQDLPMIVDSRESFYSRAGRPRIWLARRRERLRAVRRGARGDRHRHRDRPLRAGGRLAVEKMSGAGRPSHLRA